MTYGRSADYFSKEGEIGLFPNYGAQVVCMIPGTRAGGGGTRAVGDRSA